MKRTIAYVTDTHLEEPGPGQHGADALKNWQMVLSDLESRTFDELIFGGDIGAFSAYPVFFETLSEFEKSFVTPGNHDTSAHVRQFFPDHDHVPGDSGFYAFREDDGYLSLFLDSSLNKISTPQLQWLEEKLVDSEKEILLFIHHPILPVDTPVDRKYPLENRDAVKKLLIAHGSPVTIFCGHYHVEDESTLANITQYVTPAVSYQIKKGTIELEGDATYFGYRLIEIEDGNIETKVVTLYPEGF